MIILLLIPISMIVNYFLTYLLNKFKIGFIAIAIHIIILVIFLINYFSVGNLSIDGTSFQSLINAFTPFLLIIVIIYFLIQIRISVNAIKDSEKKDNFEDVSDDDNKFKN